MNTDIRNLVHQFPNEPIRDFDALLWKVFPTEMHGVRPVVVPCGEVPYEVTEWDLKFLKFRYFINNNGSHALSIKYKSGEYWILSQSDDNPMYELIEDGYNKLEDIKYYISNNRGGEVDDMTFYCFSDSSEKLYLCKLDEDGTHVSCSCPGFKHQSYGKPVDKKCKHIASVYLTYPDLLPTEIRDQDKVDQVHKDADGKVRYPRDLFDVYVSLIRTSLNGFREIEKFEFCGSYRRLNPMVSDLDVLICLKEGTNWNSVLDYCEACMGFTVVPEIGRGELKAGYLVDGLIRVDFKNVPSESWAAATLHFTGSKETNILMRRRANSMGLKLNEYGLFNESTGDRIQCDTERDIFNYLQLEYKEPWQR